MSMNSTVPVVLVFAGTDPSGGAGVQADIETLSSMGCHAAPVITAVTVQDTVDVKRYEPMDPALVVEQARAILEDVPVASIKIGMIGSVEIVEVIHTILLDYPELPVVLDPVVAAGGGSMLADDEMLDAMVNLLFPYVTVLTPNSQEARAFAQEADNLDACAQELLEHGCEYVLITGTHENTFHGSGCTLAVAIAGLLAQGLDPSNAIYEAQEYTWEALSHGYRIGMGQSIPNRLFWAHGEDDE